MANVVRRYRRVGTNNTNLTQRVGASSAVNTNYTNVIDIDVNNSTADATAALDQYMASLGFPLDAAATAVDVTAHATRHDGAGADAVPNATTAVAGLVSSTDKTKLDSITSGATSQIMIWGFESIGASADTRYIPIGCCDVNTSAPRTTEVSIPLARAGTIKNMRVYHTTAIGNGNDVVYTLMKNGSTTALTATLAANSNGPASDTTHTVSISAGDRISVQVFKGSSIAAGGLNVGGSFEFTA